MFNQLLFDTVPQSASFPFLKMAVRHPGMEMSEEERRRGKGKDTERGKREQFDCQKEAAA